MGLLSKAAAFFGRGQAGRDALEDKARNELLSELAEPDKARRDDYALYERYYDGDHNVRLTDRERQYLKRAGIPWSENFCETIIDVMADRLNVTGMLCEDNEAAQEWAEEFFEGDAIAEVAGTVHTQTPKLGDGFLGIDWDDERKTATFHWNDPAACVPVYDSADRLIMVAKSWSEAAPTPTNPEGRHIRRLNLYLADRIEKWFTEAGPGKGVQWQMHMDEGDEVWPTPWVRNDGTPRGVGIIHFRNKPKGKAYGRSELRSTIPQNDYLNKQLIDLANVLDNQGWPQRWGTGVSSKTKSVLKTVAGEIWTTPNEKAKFGQFESAEVNGILEAVDGTLRRMSGRSSTPMHLLLAGAITQLPSGESLKTAESGLIFKVKDRHPTYGLSWSTATGIAAGLEADFGESGLAFGDESFETQWQDPTSRNEKSEWEIQEVKGRVGVSRKTRLEEMGYDADKEAEQRREEAKESADAFNAGIGGGLGGGPGEGGGDPELPVGATP